MQDSNVGTEVAKETSCYATVHAVDMLALYLAICREDINSHANVSQNGAPLRSNYLSLLPRKSAI